MDRYELEYIKAQKLCLKAVVARLHEIKFKYRRRGEKLDSDFRLNIYELNALHKHYSNLVTRPKEKKD